MDLKSRMTRLLAIYHPLRIAGWWPHNAINDKAMGKQVHSWFRPGQSGWSLWRVPVFQTNSNVFWLCQQQWYWTVYRTFVSNLPQTVPEVGYLPKNAPVGRLPVAHLRLFFRSHRTMDTPNRDCSFLPPLRRSGSAGQFISSDCAAALLSYRI